MESLCIVVKTFLIVCGMEVKQAPSDKSALKNYWERILRYFYENGYDE